LGSVWGNGIAGEFEENCAKGIYVFLEGGVLNFLQFDPENIAEVLALCRPNETP
jgi:hypothetical protein